MEPHDVIVITKESHPTLFLAFEAISHDCGRQAGHRNYVVPDSYAQLLTVIEPLLVSLTPEEFSTLCIGEETEKAAIVERYGLIQTDELLQRFFEEFC